MDYIRPANERGKVSLDWLQSHYSFSFAYYYDPKHMGFSALKAINDDTVAGGAGFGWHAHRDMEIITYVLQGAIKHEDSLGNQFTINAGDVQRMSAGTGIAHSEYNGSNTEPLKFLQIWIEPNQRGGPPSYQQAAIAQTQPLTPLVTADGRQNSLTLQQNASIYRLQLNAGQQITLTAEKGVGYLHIISGQSFVNGRALASGDAVGVTGTSEITVLTGDQPVTALWFDLPPLNHA